MTQGKVIRSLYGPFRLFDPFAVELTTLAVRTAGLLMLIAGLVKFQNTLTDQTAFSSFPITLSQALFPLSIMEIVLGSLLVSGRLSRGGWWIAVSCFTVFAIASGWKSILRESECGCFGRFSPRPHSMFGIDIGILVLLLASWKWRLARRWYTVFGIASISLLTGVLASFAIMTISGAPLNAATSSTDFRLSQPETLVGLELSVLSEIDIEDNLNVGAWLVVFRRSGCSACIEAETRYEEIANRTKLEGSQFRVALIEVPVKPSTHPDTKTDGRHFSTGMLTDTKSWQVTTPLALAIIDRSTIAVWPDRSPDYIDVLRALASPLRKTNDSER